MGDQCADLTRLIWMSLLEHGKTDELMGWQVVIQPPQCVDGQLGPVTIATGNQVRVSCGVTHLIGIPTSLATGRANVLGTASNRNDVGSAAFDLERIGGCLLLFPALLIVEGVKLDIVDRTGAIDNRFLAVEERQHLITLLNVIFIGSDRDNLVFCQPIVSNPLLQLACISHRISTLEDLDIRISARSTVLDHLLSLI